MDGREERLVELLRSLNVMFEEVAGSSDPWVDALLDPQGRRSERTLNYLTASASGTLQDRIFCAENHDREPSVGFDAFNRCYRDLLTEAATLARELGLPAGRDGWPPDSA